jgi:hypothetical protein
MRIRNTAFSAISYFFHEKNVNSGAAFSLNADWVFGPVCGQPDPNVAMRIRTYVLQTDPDTKIQLYTKSSEPGR